MSQKIATQEMENLLSEAAQTGLYESGITRLTNSLNEDPENESLSFYLGLLHLKNADSVRGIEYLEKARHLDLDPGQRLRCLVFLGKAYADSGSYAQAERAFREALQTGISDPSPYSALGAVFYARKMVDQALDALEKALKIDPNYPGALNNLGYILIETQHDIERGFALCRKAVELDPNNFAYRDSLGKALIEQGWYKEAKVELRKALELSPDNISVKTHLEELKQKEKS